MHVKASSDIDNRVNKMFQSYAFEGGGVMGLLYMSLHILETGWKQFPVLKKNDVKTSPLSASLTLREL
ncbi:hypothetical protein AAC387_Pa03g0752 [Persea americana]